MSYYKITLTFNDTVSTSKSNITKLKKEIYDKIFGVEWLIKSIYIFNKSDIYFEQNKCFLSFITLSNNTSGNGLKRLITKALNGSKKSKFYLNDTLKTISMIVDIKTIPGIKKETERYDKAYESATYRKDKNLVVKDHFKKINLLIKNYQKKKNGGGLESEERKLSREYRRCTKKTGPSVFIKHNFNSIKRSKFMDYKNDNRSKIMDYKDILKLRSKILRDFKKTHKKEFLNYRKRSKKITKECKKHYSKKKGKLKKKFKKEIKERNKINSKKCCKCQYVKYGKTLRRVRGAWGHCRYDTNTVNCCKDKKTIIKIKKL